MANENRLERDTNQLNERNKISLSIRSVWLSIRSAWSFFAVRFMGNKGSMDGEDESGFADAQADYIIHWPYMSLCWICRAPTQLCS